jgi:hypothetical protein
MINSSPTAKKRGNESGANQFHLQLASLLHFIAQPPPLGRVP